MTRIFHRLFVWKWIPCQASTSVLCLLFRPKTVHCSAKNSYNSKISFLALVPWSYKCLSLNCLMSVSFIVILPKRTWSILHWVVQIGQYDWIPIRTCCTGSDHPTIWAICVFAACCLYHLWSNIFLCVFIEFVVFFYILLYFLYLRAL